MSELEQKKTEIEKLLDELDLHLTRSENLKREFNSHLKRVGECQREATRLMLNDSTARVFATDPAGETAATEIFDRMQRLASKFQSLTLGGDPHGPS